MNSFYNFFRGSADVKVAGESSERFINICAENDIIFWGLRRRDDTLFLTVSLSDLPYLKPCADRAYCTLELIGKSGAPPFLRQFRRRFFLIFGLATAMLLVFFFNRYIWEITISGAETVPESEILGVLAEEGVGIGTLSSSVSPKALKNTVLLKSPELSWFTINVNGSKAEIIVREETEAPETVDEDTPADLISSSTGIITEVQVYAGVARVSVGDAVFKGDVLIEGVFESNETVTEIRALGEVRALTLYNISACRPLTESVKAATGEERKRFSLIFVENRINLYGGGSNLWTKYDKIIEYKQITLFGTLELPIFIVTQSFEEYDLTESETDIEKTVAELEETLLEEVKSRVDDGEILSVSYESETENGLVTVTIRAECEEVISVTSN